MKILYVDNDSTFASIVCPQFMSQHEVEVVPSLHAGRMAIKGKVFDAVLVDYDLDDGKGDTLVEELRSSGFRGQIIAVSSRDEGNDALMRAGADGVCNKLKFSGINQLLHPSTTTKSLAFCTSQHVEGAGPECEDRTAVFSSARQLILVVADGAGGTGGGAAAAEMIVRNLGASLTRATTLHHHDWVKELNGIDRAMFQDQVAGEATGVVAAISPTGQIRGASIGDSAAWLIEGRDFSDLTANQKRKPLLGSGEAEPVPFTGTIGGQTLLLATDGLVKYVRVGKIAEMIAGSADLSEAVFGLVSEAKSATGSLQDDVAILLCRAAE